MSTFRPILLLQTELISRSGRFMRDCPLGLSRAQDKNGCPIHRSGPTSRSTLHIPMAYWERSKIVKGAIATSNFSTVLERGHTVSRKFASFALSLAMGMVVFGSIAIGQTLPLKGPGLGNLSYTDAELFSEISVIDWNTSTYTNGIPQKQYTIEGKTSPQKPYGTNVGIMLNGYFLTMFAPDSGQATGGFLLYDVSDPRNIKLVKTIYEPKTRTAEFREPHAFGVSKINGKDYVAVPSIKGVEFWDFTDINDIKQVKKLELPGVNGGDYENVNWQMWWQAPYLYIASASRGLFIVDARDPANAKLADRGGKLNPIPIGSLGGFRIGPIFAMGNHMLLSSMETTAGFASLDISDPLNPVLIATKTTLPKYYATCFNGKKLYTSGRDATGKFAGYELTDVRTIKIENENTSVAEGLYCASQDNNLIIGAQRRIIKYDVSDPARYVEIGRSAAAVETTTEHPDLGQVAMFGNLVFVGSDHGYNTAFRPHQKNPDTAKPAVIATSPVNGAQHQAVTSRIGFGLSDSILPETVNSTNFIVRPKGGTQILGTFSLQLGMINFSPNEPLKLSTEYEVVLKANGLKDFAGNGIAHDYILNFKTGDEAAPTSYVNRWPLIDSLIDIASSNDGIASGADKYAENGLDMRGRTGGVPLEDDTVAEILGSTATVSFRIKTSQFGSNSQWAAPGIFGRDQVNGTSDVFWGWIDASGYLNLSVGNRTTTNPGTRSSTAINDGQWHEVAMTRNAETGVQTMHVDGIKTTSNSTVGVLGIANKLQRLGQIEGSPVAFDGILSDVRVYPRVLSDTEIRTVFNSEQTVLAPQSTNKPVSLTPADLGLSGSQYIWNFGDGSNPIITSSSNPTATYTYPLPGNYTISVTAVAPDGSETTQAFIQSVSNPRTVVPPIHTSNIIGSGNFVYALNPDSGTVTQIDASTQKKTWEIKVGIEPKTLAFDQNGNIWTTVQGEDKLVRINPMTKELVSFPLDYGSAPYGVVFTRDGNGLVTLAGKSILAVFNPFTGDLLTQIALPGGDVRGIAVSGDSKFAYLTRFRSKMTQAEVYKVDLNTRIVSTIPLYVDTKTRRSEAAAPGVANYLNQIVISPDGMRAILPSKKDNIVDGRFRNNIDLRPDTTVRSILSQLDLLAGKEVFSEQIDFNNRAPARAAVFAPSGNYIFVAQMESNSVEIVDPYKGAVIGSVDGVGNTPHGLYLDDKNNRLYVNSFLDRAVTVHDVSKVLSGIDFLTPAPTLIPTVLTEPLAANMLAGKKVFYNAADPRMSNEGYISCASCHVDGDSDNMVWDFTQRGEGLRRTISLQGHGLSTSTGGKLHWTANFDELQDFEKDIRDEFGGVGFLSPADYQSTIDPLGNKKAGLSQELDNVASYIASLKTIPRSPHRNAQGCLTAAAISGKAIFDKKQCSTCHVDAIQGDGSRHDVGTIQLSSGTGSGNPLSGSGFDTPSLYGLWQSSPLFHNGQADSLSDVFLKALLPSVTKEAEATDNTLSNGAQIASCASCSGGKIVKWIGGANSGALMFNAVSVPKSGAYNITISYINGDTSRSAQISVNGDDPIAMSFPKTGSWGGAVGTKSISLRLVSGANTIRISNPTSTAPDIDKIVVTSGPNVSPQHGGSVDSTETANLVAYIQSIDGAASCAATLR